MTLDEAFQILDVSPEADHAEIRRAYAMAIGRPNVDDEGLRQVVEALNVIEARRGKPLDSTPSSLPSPEDDHIPTAFERRYGRGTPLLRGRLLVGSMVVAFVLLFRVFHSCADSDETLPGMTPGQSEELKRRFHRELVNPPP